MTTVEACPNTNPREPCKRCWQRRLRNLPLTWLQQGRKLFERYLAKPEKALPEGVTQLEPYTDKATAPADDIEPIADTPHGIYPQIFTAAPGSWHYFCIDVSYRHQEDLPGIQVGFSPPPLARSRSTACVLSRDLGLRVGGGEANEFDGQEERAPNVSEGWQQAQCHQACR